jgi:lipid II:glycine glycyltransferase (peptidoglycan interpeptide bridge formation enzyme)
MKRFLNPLLQLSEELSVSHTEIRTLSSCSLMPQNDFTVNWGFKNHFLDLTSDPENVKKHFHRTCVKQRIKRSQSHNLKLKIGRDQRELKTFYRLYAISRKQHGLPPQPYVFFKNMWDIFSPSGKLTLYLAVKDGNAIGGSILFKFKKRVSAEFMVMDKTYRSINPNHFLFWEAIKSACYEGYEIFDFGRTYHTNEPLMNFKKRWGTQTIDMPQFYFPARPTEKSGQKEDSMAYQFISNICRKAPDTVLQMLGFFCYRHLG